MGAVPDSGLCEVDGCDNPATRAGYCWGHVKRRQRQQPVSSPLAEACYRSKQERLTVAALELADVSAEDDADWRRAWDRLRKAAVAYATEQGHPAPRRSPRPPPSSGAQHVLPF